MIRIKFVIILSTFIWKPMNQIGVHDYRLNLHNIRDFRKYTIDSIIDMYDLIHSLFF